MSSTDTLEVYGFIGDPGFFASESEVESATTLSKVSKFLSSASSDRIQLRINSPGGDAFEGIAIYNRLREQSRPVDVVVDGLSASAASIVQMAGETITMATGSIMMVHDPWAMCMGNAQDMRKAADDLDRVGSSAIDIYETKTGQPREELKSLMHEETYLTAEESVELGFATETSAEKSQTMMFSEKAYDAIRDRMPLLPAAMLTKRLAMIADADNHGENRLQRSWDLINRFELTKRRYASKV